VTVVLPASMWAIMPMFLSFSSLFIVRDSWFMVGGWSFGVHRRTINNKPLTVHYAHIKKTATASLEAISVAV
jgi:hypothetical protein